MDAEHLGSISKALLALGVCLGMAPKAYAGCGLDPICAVSSDIGGGVGSGLADSLRPLIAQTMEQDAPALINDLQSAVDHNIMTADQAGQQLIDIAQGALMAAEDNAELRGEQLVAFTRKEIDDAETKFLANLNVLLQENWDRLNCEIQGGNAALTQQQTVFWDSANNLLNRFSFFGRRRVDHACRVQLGISDNATELQLGPLSTFQLWECYRMQLVSDQATPTQISTAYSDVEIKAFGLVCAWRNASAAGLQTIAREWNEAGAAGTAWARAENGQ